MCTNQPRLTPDALLQALQGAADAAAYYERLRALADEADRATIEQLHNDENNIAGALAALYAQLTGAAVPVLRAREPVADAYPEGLRAALLLALEQSESYRCLALGCDNAAPRLLFDLMESKNRQALLLNMLYTGWVERHCCAGTPELPEPPLCDGLTHTVQSGEGLWLIAQRYGVTVEALLAANPQVGDPGNLYVGQVLCIPCAGLAYTVQAGDSLWALGQRYGLSVDQILAANPLVDPGNLAIGQVLCLPCAGCGAVPAEPRESLSYLYGGTAATYLQQLDATRESLCTVCPDFFELDQNGNLLLASAGKLNAEFVAELHARGLKVTPFVSNHWDRALGVTALSNRAALSDQLAAAVAQYGLDGVNFDLENITDVYRDAYTDLVRLTRAKLPEGTVVSIAVAANPNGWTAGWHGSYDYRALAEICDYLVIMAYDEHYQGGPEGPVASADFFERSVQYALGQGVAPEKIVMGIPFFGRYWRQGAASGGIGLADRDVETLLAGYNSSAGYDEAAQSAWAVVTIAESDPPPVIWGGRTMGAGTYDIWYDNLRATRWKLERVRELGLRGVGSWALGQENPAIWDFYSVALNG